MNENGGSSGRILLVLRDDNDMVVCLSAYSETRGEDIVRRAPESFFGDIKELVRGRYQGFVDWFDRFKEELDLSEVSLDNADCRVFIDTTLPYRRFEVSRRNGKLLDGGKPPVVASPFSDGVRHLAEITRYSLHGR